MNQEQQRIAIAEWMGAKEISPSWIALWPRPVLPMLVALRMSPANHLLHDDWVIAGVPDYPNDLNAMHEAENNLAHTFKYQLWLDRMTRRNEWCATAQQRCEAMCRTLWPEKFLI